MGEVIEIRTKDDAIAYGDGWAAHAARIQAQIERVQMAFFVAETHRKATELLLREAEKEAERLRGLIE